MLLTSVRRMPAFQSAEALTNSTRLEFDAILLQDYSETWENLVNRPERESK